MRTDTITKDCGCVLHTTGDVITRRDRCATHPAPPIHLAVCELDAHGESNGIVFFFDTPECRTKFLQANAGASLSAFDDGEPIDGTVCDSCGKVLA
jgi:hypothetical protein